MLDAFYEERGLVKDHVGLSGHADAGVGRPMSALPTGRPRA
jgi:hypothetical protein